MVEAIFPPSSNWFHSKIMSTREDGTVAYGSQNHIFVLEILANGGMSPIIIEAHRERVRSVAFCPVERRPDGLNYILSASDDGFVKLWDIVCRSTVMGHNSHSAPKELSKVVCATWSPCNPRYAVSVAENDTVILWNTGNNTTSRFYFSKLKASVIECSYHDEKVLGVGSKSGMIYIIRLNGKGELLHRLRGHDKEIQGLSWRPLFDVKELENINAKCLLASSSQEKEIFIWKIIDGSCFSKVTLPKVSLLANGEQQQQPIKWDSANAFIPIFWASPNHLYSSSKWGELVCCNPELLSQSEETKDATQKNKQKGPGPWKLVHKIHTNVILAIAGVPIRNRPETAKRVTDLLKMGGSRSVRCMNEGFASFEMGFYEPTTLPKQGLIWTIGKDQRLVAIGKDPKENPRFYFHTINGQAFVSEVLPIDPHVLAIGAGDGKIRKWNVTDMTGEAQMFGQKINDRVYSLAWHPYRETILGFGTSEGRVGLIDVFSARNPSHMTTTHGGKVYRLSWGPALTEKEITSTDKKDLILYSVGGHKILCHHPKSLKSESFELTSQVPCKKYVDIAWRSDFSLLAVGSKRGYIYIIKYPKFDVISSVSATSKCVMALTWHPPMTTLGQDCTSFRGYLSFASIDCENVIKVYNCTEVNEVHKIEKVAILKGHYRYIQFVSWSPHISGRILSAGADFTVRIWDVTACTQLSRYNLSHSILPLFCMWSPIDPDIIIAGFTERMVLSFRLSVGTDLGPVVRVIKPEKGRIVRRGELLNGDDIIPVDESELEELIQPEKTEEELNLAKRNEDQKAKREEKMFKTAWNLDANLFQTCYELLKSDETETVPEYNFSFLKPPNDFFDHIAQEDELFKASNNWGLHYQLALWKGNLNEIIEEHITTGQLDDYLLSIAPFVSHRMWQRACDAYAKVLAEKKQYRKAASYLLAIHKLPEAIDMLVDANLFLEAICMARCRVPDIYSLLPSLIRKYGDWLAETGNSLKASECFIYLNEFSEAVTVLAKKNQPEYLSLAALASRRGGLFDREAEYAYRALVICLENEKYQLAARICSDHPTVKKLYPLYKVHQLLIKLDSDQQTLAKDLISDAKELIGTDDIPEIYGSLQYIYDKNIVYPYKKNMLATLAHEIVLACCAPDSEMFLTHIITAMSTASKFILKEKADLSMVYKLVTWLYPGGIDTYLTRDSIFGCDDENVTPKQMSLRGFLCSGLVDFMRYSLDLNTEAVRDINIYAAMVDKLLKYGLDKRAFDYVRDQVNIRTVEKRINEAYRRKNELKGNSCLVREVRAKINGAESSEACLKVGAWEPEKVNKVSSEDDIIASESVRMTRIKDNLNEFEQVRINAPNPALIFCVLRDVWERINEMDRFNHLEKLFQELQQE